MQRLLTYITTCLLCITATAQWSGNPAENLLCWPDGASYNYTELAMGGDGTSWLMVNYPGGENGAATKLVAVDTTGVKLFGEEGLTQNCSTARVASLCGKSLHIFTLCDEKTEKTNLRSTVMHNNGFWTVRWHDDGPLGSEEDIERIYMQRVNRNRSIGNPEGAAVNLPQYSHHDAHFGSYIDSGYLSFDINMKKNSHVLINIYNLNGKFVAQPFNGYLASGSHTIEWNENCEAGAYIAVLKTHQSTQTIKLILR